LWWIGTQGFFTPAGKSACRRPRSPQADEGAPLALLKDNDGFLCAVRLRVARVNRLRLAVLTVFYFDPHVFDICSP
jgi:hypothetical protein